jgi:hypothetical protein
VEDSETRCVERITWLAAGRSRPAAELEDPADNVTVEVAVIWIVMNQCVVSGTERNQVRGCLSPKALVRQMMDFEILDSTTN